MWGFDEENMMGRRGNRFLLWRLNIGRPLILKKNKIKISVLVVFVKILVLCEPSFSNIGV